MSATRFVSGDIARVPRRPVAGAFKGAGGTGAGDALTGGGWKGKNPPARIIAESVGLMGAPSQTPDVAWSISGKAIVSPLGAARTVSYLFSSGWRPASASSSIG